MRRKRQPAQDTPRSALPPPKQMNLWDSFMLIMRPDVDPRGRRRRPRFPGTTPRRGR